MQRQQEKTITGINKLKAQNLLSSKINKEISRIHTKVYDELKIEQATLKIFSIKPII